MQGYPDCGGQEAATRAHPREERGGDWTATFGMNLRNSLNVDTPSIRPPSIRPRPEVRSVAPDAKPLPALQSAVAHSVIWT